MSSELEKSNLKRSAEDEAEEKKTEDDEDDAGWIGPLPTEQSAASKPKKKKGLLYMYIDSPTICVN